MATLFCMDCRKELEFFTIGRAQRVADVCRSTIYYWIHKGWVHSSQLPSGRRMICRASLMGAGRNEPRMSEPLPVR